MPTKTKIKEKQANGRPSAATKEAVYALAERRALLLDTIYSDDCVRWIRDEVKTKDEHEKIQPVKSFPILPYVEPMIKMFNTETVVLVVKSRQMMISWLACAYGLWMAQFFSHQLILVISEKFDKSAALVNRMRFIYERQSPWLLNLHPPEKYVGDMPQGTLSLANGSKVIGLPEGPDQVRMHTASLAIIDEADFHLTFKKTYEACLPAVHGGGKLIAMSTVNAGQFSKMCNLI